MQAVGYVRDIPGSADHTLYAQRERLRSWARSTSSPLVAVFQDESNTDDRPGLRTLWASVSEFDVVAVDRPDVFSTNLITQELIIERLESAGVAVVVSSEPSVGDIESSSQTALREVVRNVISAQDALAVLLTSRTDIERAPMFLEIVPEAPTGLDTESAV